MKLEDLIRATSSRSPGEPGKIPWDDPAFSARMLREHLSQEHGRASRRFDEIDRHVRWIHEAVLGSTPGRVLDLGCGPGLYTARLARLGHRCVGVDFSPASIAYAREEALRDSLRCEYHLRDIREFSSPPAFEAVLLLFGEWNTFAPADALGLLTGARRALVPSGALVLEVHRFDAVRSRGERAPSWFAAGRSVFADGPHLCLTESSWDAEGHRSVERFFVLQQDERELRTYTSTTHAYADDEIARLLTTAGFVRVERHPSLDGAAETSNPDLTVLVCR
jgi:SAM-dependent methyltransferase